MADGINKTIVLKKESSYGAKAANTGGRYYPRTSGNFQIEKSSFNSNSIRPSQQMAFSGNGTEKATGSIQDDLACGNFDELQESLLRRDFTGGAVASSVAVAISASEPNLVRASGSWLSAGLRKGMIVDVSGADTPADNERCLVIGVTANNLNLLKSDKTAFTADAAATVTVTQVGKWTYTPQTGHTNQSFTAEEWNSDITLSQITLGQQVNSMAVSSSPEGFLQATFNFMGKNGEATTSSQYFAGAAAVSGNEGLESASGLIVIDGVISCRVTSFSLDVSANITQEPAIACQGIAATSRDKVMATGSFTAIMDDGTYQDALKNSSEIEIFYAPKAADGEMMGFFMSRCKVGNVTKDDGAKVTIVTVPFSVLEYVGSSADTIQTTLIISDTSL